MGKEMYKVMAVWMSALIIMLPFYVSDVFAADADVINVRSIKGGDGIKGIRRTEGDFTKIEVEVFSSKQLTAQNIQLKSTSPGAAPVTFQTCTDISPYLCTWKSSAGDLPAGAYGFYTCIGNCDTCFQVSCKKRAIIYADGVAPTVNLLTADPVMTNGGEIKIHYKITDLSCLAARCLGYCSGLEKAELYDVGEDGSENLVGTIDIDSEECTVEDDYDFIASGMENGERKLCMVPYDKFDQSLEINTAGPNCVAIKKDDQMPSFETVRLMDPLEGYDLTHVSGTGTEGKFVVNFTISTLFELVDDQLIADLSEIGGSNRDTIPCSDLGGGLWSCSKTSIIRVSSSGSQNVQLSAVDEGGNNNTQTFAFNLNVDSVDPIVDKITTGYELDEVPYLKVGLNRVNAVITETGSGLSENNVYFGVGSANRAVCLSSGEKWNCYANITATSGVLVVSVHGEDDAGNSFAKARNIMVDSIKPSVEKIIIANTNGNPYFVVNDDMLIKAYIRDNRGLVGDSGGNEVYMTPMGFADPNPVLAESCEYDDEEYYAWLCQWTIMDVAPGDVKIDFNISDFVGNTIATKRSRFAIEYLEPATGNYTTLPSSAVEVYEVEGQAADYWTATAKTPMPSTVDSATTEVIEHDVWIPLELTPRTGAVIFSVELSGCTGEDFGNYAKDAILVRPSPRSNYPFVRVSLKRGAIDALQMNFECALNIVSKHRGKISQLEVEVFNATVPVTSHGELSYQVLIEILRVSRGWLVRATWIETIGKIMDIFNKICGLIAAVSTAIRDITLLLNVHVNACEGNPFCGYTVKPSEMTVKGLKKGEVSFWKISFKFCEYVRCSKTIWGKYTLDWLNNALGPVTDSLNKILSFQGLGTGGPKAEAPEIAEATAMFGITGRAEGGGDTGGDEATERREREMREQLGLVQKTGLIGPVYAWGNPRNSLILSIATGCLPGIVMNLQKARQIECQYLSCLINDVPGGMPLAACTKVRNFQWCMFVFGEIFQVIPFIGSIKNILSPIIGMLRDPLTLIFGIVGMVCEFLPTARQSVGCHALNAINSVINIINVLKEIAGAKDLFKLGGADSCKETLQRADGIISKSLGVGYSQMYGTTAGAPLATTPS